MKIEVGKVYKLNNKDFLHTMRTTFRLPVEIGTEFICVCRREFGGQIWVEFRPCGYIGNHTFHYSEVDHWGYWISVEVQVKRYKNKRRSHVDSQNKT